MWWTTKTERKRRWHFYRRIREIRSAPRWRRVMAVEVESGGAFRAGVPKVLFEGRYRRLNGGTSPRTPNAS